METINSSGIVIVVVPEDGPLFGPGDANDLISMAWSADAQLVAVPVARLAPEFFTLSSGLAGEFFQKFQNYGVRLAIVGDITGPVAASTALRDFVIETNRVGHHLFVESLAVLTAAPIMFERRIAGCSDNADTSFKFVEMTEEFAKISTQWQYDGIYEVYGHDPENPHDLSELEAYGWQDSQFAALNAHGEFVGILQAERKPLQIVVEFYLRPDLTGKGHGVSFVRSSLNFLVGRNPLVSEFVLFVNSFNMRAIKVYKSVGFKLIREVTAKSYGPVEKKWLGERYTQYEMRLSIMY